MRGKMAEEKKEESKEEIKNSKKTIIIIILAVLLLGTILILVQQNSNKNSIEKQIEELSQSASQEKTDSEAGTIGKNEVKLTDGNFKAEIEDYKGVALVDFYLSTCPHCKNVAKDVTEVSDQMAGKAKVGKLEARENNSLSDRFKIESVPTFVVFKDGKEVERKTGEMKKDELLKLVEKYTK